jgi:hypothetical protein
VKTVIFEEKYNTDISKFSSTREVDDFLEKKLGRPLRVVDVEATPVVDYHDIYTDINKILDKMKAKRGI